MIYATAAITVTDLIVQNGVASGSDSACPYSGCGGGIYADNLLTLYNVQVLTSTAENGGGVYGDMNVSIGNSYFANNIASSEGGGLRSVNGATVTGTTFLSNSATSAAGGALFDSDATVADSSFTSNTTDAAGSAGGGYFNGNATLSNVTFTDNHAGSLGGGGAVFVGIATLSGGSFSGNSATFAGGGACFGGAVTATGTTFSDNSATTNRGGGAYFNSFCKLVEHELHWQQHPGGSRRRCLLPGSSRPFSHKLYQQQCQQSGRVAPISTLRQLTDTDFISNTGTVRARTVYFGGVATVTGGSFQFNRCTVACLGGALFATNPITLMSAQFSNNTSDAG